MTSVFVGLKTVAPVYLVCSIRALALVLFARYLDRVGMMTSVTSRSSVIGALGYLVATRAELRNRCLVSLSQ